MPVFISLCTVDFGYHSGCGDGWRCWLFLRRRTTAMFVRSRLQTYCSGQQPRPRRPPASVHAKFAPSSTDATPLKYNVLAEICRDTGEAGRGRARVVVYLQPGAVHDDGRRLPGPRKTQPGRKEKFPINSGNWYKLCHHTIQSQFLFYRLHRLTHASDSGVLCF